MPKPTRTPERIKLLHGWTMDAEALPLSKAASIKLHMLYRPDGCSVGGVEQFDELPQLIAALQSPAPTFDITKLSPEEQANLIAEMHRPRSITPLQSPAGEWRDITEDDLNERLALIYCKFGDYEGISVAKLWDGLPMWCWKVKHPKDCILLMQPLPPAPTRSQGRSACSGER